MLSCTESGTNLTGNVKIFAICPNGEKKNALPISVEVFNTIPELALALIRRTSQGKGLNCGVNICKARIVGGDEFERLSFDPDTDFLYSVEESDLMNYLPKVWARIFEITVKNVA